MNANSCADCALTSSVNELQLSQPPFQRKKEGHRHHRGRGAAVAGWRSYRRDELHRFGGLSGWRRQLAGRHGRTGDDPMPTRRPVKARTESPTPAQGQRARSARRCRRGWRDLRGSANLSAIAQLSTCKCRMRKAGGRQDKIHARKVAKRLADRHPVFVQKILLQLAHDKKRSGAREDARLARGRERRIRAAGETKTNQTERSVPFPSGADEQADKRMSSPQPPLPLVWTSCR